MENSKPMVPSTSLILKKIAEDKALTLFNNIAVADGDKYIPLKEMNLTTKQYYSRISGLLSVGLIRRHKGKYSLTMLGKVVYQSQMTIGKTLAYFWKLKAIESIEMSSGNKMPEHELTQLVTALIDNHQVKDILLKSVSVRSNKPQAYPNQPLLAKEQQSNKKSIELQKIG